MNLEIVKYPNSVLRKRAQEVKEITPEIKRLCLDMIEIMTKNNGVGLAAPQVGQSKMIIVAQASDGPKIFINPKILNKSKETEIMEEGCLSFPDIFLSIKRAKSVEFSALDENGKEVHAEVVGFFARILQHEVGHLYGDLIIDRTGFLQKLKWIFKLRISKQK
jgi:peptide deformylase